MEVSSVLQDIYRHNAEEKALLKKCKKEDLADFILEIFNKGLLDRYIGLKNS